MFKQLLTLTSLCAASLLLSNCSSVRVSNPALYGAGAESRNTPLGGSTRSPMVACNVPAERPGLATGWGGKIDDKVKRTVFTRDSRRPHTVVKIHYNDQTGAYAMTGGDYRYSNSFRDYGGGIFRLGLRNHRGGALSAFEKDGMLVSLGESGERYTVEIENLCDHRLEFLVSVDGLDVLSGKPGGYGGRGYVLDPGERREIRGWRTSMNEVATFRFGGTDKSYAGNRTGSTRNVGVIGCAVFAEKGTNPRPYAGTDSWRRLHAEPFIADPDSGGFATPVE